MVEWIKQEKERWRIVGVYAGENLDIVLENLRI